MTRRDIEYITERALLERFNSLPGVSISRSTFKQSLRGVMAAAGDAVRVAGGPTLPWLYATDKLEAWDKYLMARARLMRDGVWPQKRPYSIADMHDVLDGLYDEHL